MEKQRVVIVAGGQLGKWALQEIRANDILIGADRGALYLVENGLKPQMALGDFDSVTTAEFKQIQQSSEELSRCDPVAKDWTDTEMALQQALRRHPAEIVILGALGSRFDHALANVHLLLKAIREGVRCRIIDSHNDITLVSEAYPAVLTKGRFTYVSLLPLSPKVSGVTLEGFRYPLNQATLVLGQSIGVSNVIVQETGRISVGDGYLLAIQSRD